MTLFVGMLSGTSPLLVNQLMNRSKKRGASRRATQNKSSGPASGRVLKIENAHFPLQMQTQLRTKFKIRYVAPSGNGNINITRGNVLNSIIMNSGGANTNYRLLAAVKVNRIELFGFGSTSTSFPSPIRVEWFSSYGPSTEYSAWGNQSQPARVNSVPPPLSLCSFWSISGSNESDLLFAISGLTPGSVIDVWYDMVFQDAEAVTSVTTNSTGTTGQIYYTPLNGPNVSPGTSAAYAADLLSLN